MARQFWTDEDKQLLAKFHPDTSNADLAVMFSRKKDAIESMAHAMRLKKTQAYKRALAEKNRFYEAGAANRFKKGQTSWNKGRKGYLSEPQAMALIPTQFKKGNQPLNTLPVGTVTVDSYGCKKIKLGEPNVWQFLHRHVYEAEHGPIPKGHALIFRDGNKLNCALDNLQLLTRAELMARNSIQNYPLELQQAIRAVNKLKTTIRETGNDDNEQCERLARGAV